MFSEGTRHIGVSIYYLLQQGPQPMAHGPDLAPDLKGCRDRSLWTRGQQTRAHGPSLALALKNAWRSLCMSPNACVYYLAVDKKVC